MIFFLGLVRSPIWRVLAALAVASCGRAQDFITNCTWQTAVLNGTYLGAFCNNDNWVIYSYDWAWFDLSNCLTNDNGQLAVYESGYYGNTCAGCSIRPSPVDFILTCTCLYSGSSLANSSIDLNKIIWNHDGFLGCFERYGTRVERGPF
ncbi:hypothetical protein F5Y17DRAFT_453992 [Xylariaceae sp. FL0594]|nr:hypothetical protein F5Y17DRAFT_453992 [Xylariaceae sp. FL0594]